MMYNSNGIGCVTEMKKVSGQIDHLNDYLSKAEDRIKLNNKKIQEMLASQQEERVKRRESFKQVYQLVHYVVPSNIYL